MTFVNRDFEISGDYINKKISMKGRVMGVSLGPGDPELITLKALKVLNMADVIFCPATQSCDGQEKSRSLDILRQLPVDAVKIHTFHVPMSRKREEAEKAYDQVCTEIIRLARSRGKPLLLQLREMLVFTHQLIICIRNYVWLVFRWI